MQATLPVRQAVRTHNGEVGETVTGADINDPLNLIAVDAGANRSKSDGDTATWLPPNKAYRCTYVAGQVAVKKKYGLWVTEAEKAAMERVLSGCPGQKLPSGGNPTTAPERFHAN
ncbi:hypothetical protein GCM10010307_67680 [Streptomyces vastus]|uniref:GmrSD restriction endonucleases C-terminal domain-containing protein n=1 Tax=Streptomyces vastus TaxID=285451 RepID=A0ABN3RLA4_9ACTN